jgi:hypothetical protein
MSPISIVTDTKYNTLLYFFALFVAIFSLITTFSSPNFKNIATLNFPNILSISVGLFVCLTIAILGFIKTVVYQKYFVDIINKKTKNYKMILDVKSIIIITFLEIFVFSFCTIIVTSPLIFGDKLTSDNIYIVLYLSNIGIDILTAIINVIGQFSILKEVEKKNNETIYAPLLYVNQQSTNKPFIKQTNPSSQIQLSDKTSNLSINSHPNNYIRIL